MIAPHARRGWVGTLAAAAISLGMLAFVFLKIQLRGGLQVGWRFDPQALWSAISAHPLAFALFALAEAALIPLRAVRWGFVLPPRKTGVAQRYHAVALGALAQNILPARAGELVRALALARSCPEVGRTRSLATVAVAKLAELAALLTYVALVPLMIHLAPDKMAPLRHLGELGVALLVGLTGLALLITRARGQAHRIEAALRRLPGKLGKKLAVGLEELAHGAAACGSFRRLLGSYVTSLLHVGVSIAGFAVAMHGVGAPASFGGAAVVVAAVSLGMSVPSSPSGVGLYHLVCLYALTALGVDPLRAVAFGLVTHLLSVAVNTGMGALSLICGSCSLSELLARPQAPRPLSDVAAS